MKKFCVLFTIAFCLLSSSLFAIDFIAGAKAGYFIWSPYFNELPNSGINDLGHGDGFLAGPVFSVMPTADLAISVSALFGKQSGYWTDNGDVTSTWSDQKAFGTHYAVMKRRDIDSAISYRISDNLKIIAGFKYQNIEMTYKETVIFIQDTGPGDSSVHHHVLLDIPSYGPALGIGYVYAISDILFATVNLNGLYMWSKLSYKANNYDQYKPDGADSLSLDPQRPGLDSYETRQAGFNLEPAIGLKADQNIILTLGLRYQMLKTKFVDRFFIPGADVDLTPDGWITDSIYGVFVSAMYVF